MIIPDFSACLFAPYLSIGEEGSGAGLKTWACSFTTMEPGPIITPEATPRYLIVTSPISLRMNLETFGSLRGEGWSSLMGNRL